MSNIVLNFFMFIHSLICITTLRQGCDYLHFKENEAESQRMENKTKQNKKVVLFKVTEKVDWLQRLFSPILNHQHTLLALRSNNHLVHCTHPVRLSLQLHTPMARASCQQGPAQNGCDPTELYGPRPCAGHCTLLTSLLLLRLPLCSAIVPQMRTHGFNCPCILLL